MRTRALFFAGLALALLLAVSACGGGESGGSSTGFFETSTGFTETSAPPATETQPTQEAFKLAIPKAGEPIGPQSPVEQISDLQKALLLLNYKIGKADGIYGAKTRKAVVKFQKAHHLEADGLVGPKTAKAINKELAKLQSQP